MDVKARGDCLVKPHCYQKLFIRSLMGSIPENAALGIILAAGAVNVALLVSIFISKLPEGLASTHDMKSCGLKTKYVLALWFIALVIGTI